MKKIMLSCVSLALAAGLQAKMIELVSVDTALIAEKSKAGQAFAEKLRAERAKLEAFVSAEQKELVKMQDEITLKAQILSKDALQEKSEQLALKQREFQRKATDKEEAARMTMQRENLKFHKEQSETIKQLCEKKGWDALLDKQSALFVSNSIDRTDEVLKALDEAFDQKNAASKAAKKDEDKKVAKREIKVA
jgi:Skp family chaperone for outer membrane proteins